MSSYLSFRKNGVNVISFSRNSEIYEVLRYQAPIGEWAPVDSKALCEGLEELYDSKQRCLNYKKTQEKALEYLSSAEDIYEALSSIQDIEEQIEGIERCIAYLDLLIKIAKEHVYEYRNGVLEEKEIKFEWKID